MGSSRRCNESHWNRQDGPLGGVDARGSAGTALDLKASLRSYLSASEMQIRLLDDGRKPFIAARISL